MSSLTRSVIVNFFLALAVVPVVLLTIFSLFLAPFVVIAVPVMLLLKHGWIFSSTLFGALVYYFSTRRQVEVVFARKTISELVSALEGYYDECQIESLSWPGADLPKRVSGAALISQDLYLLNRSRVFRVRPGPNETVAQQKCFILPSRSYIFVDCQPETMGHFQQFQMYHEVSHSSPHCTVLSRDSLGHMFRAVFMLVIVTHLYVGVIPLKYAVLCCFLPAASLATNLYLAARPKSYHELLADLIGLVNFSMFHRPVYRLDYSKVEDECPGLITKKQDFLLFSDGKMLFSPEEISKHLEESHPELVRFAGVITKICKLEGVEALPPLVRKLHRFRSKQSGLHRRHLEKLTQIKAIASEATSVNQFVIQTSIVTNALFPQRIHRLASVILTPAAVACTILLVLRSTNANLDNATYVAFFLLMAGSAFASFVRTDLRKAEETSQKLGRLLHRLPEPPGGSSPSTASVHEPL